MAFEKVSGIPRPPKRLKSCAMDNSYAAINFFPAFEASVSNSRKLSI